MNELTFETGLKAVDSVESKKKVLSDVNRSCLLHFPNIIYSSESSFKQNLITKSTQKNQLIVAHFMLSIRNIPSLIHVKRFNINVQPELIRPINI